jgi:hypothetical protein
MDEGGVHTSGMFRKGDGAQVHMLREGGGYVVGMGGGGSGVWRTGAHGWSGGGA